MLATELRAERAHVWPGTHHASLQSRAGEGTYHGGGVGPVGVNARVRVEHALVGAGHGHGDGGVRVREPALGGHGVDVGGAEGDTGRGGADTAGVAAHARGELGEVVDDFEHCSAHKHGLSLSVASAVVQVRLSRPLQIPPLLAPLVGASCCDTRIL